MSHKAGSTSSKRKREESLSLDSNSKKPSKSACSKGKASKRDVSKSAEQLEVEEEDIDSEYGLSLQEALKKGLRSPQVRLERNISDESLIGARCEIYWPGDAAWYDGTVVLISSDCSKCFVYYDDGMAEWVDTAKHGMTVVTGLAVVGNWVVRRVWVSKKAVEINEIFKQLSTGRIYITYVRSKPLHAFVKSSETTEFYSKRHSRKTVKNLDLALAEIEQKRAVIKDVLAALMACDIIRWPGASLVGHTVRAPLTEFLPGVYRDSVPKILDDADSGRVRKRNRIAEDCSSMVVTDPDRSAQDSAAAAPRSNETVDQELKSAVYLLGCVKAYNKILDKFFIEWSTPSDRGSSAKDGRYRFVPRWVRLACPSGACYREAGFNRTKDVSDVTIRAELCLQTDFPEVSTFVKEPQQSASISDDDGDLLTDIEISCEGEEATEAKSQVCALCSRREVHFLGAKIDEGCFDHLSHEARENVYESVFDLTQCSKCLNSFHTSCMPDLLCVNGEKGKKSSSRSISLPPWTCWFCLECDECKSTVWETQLNLINIKDLVNNSEKTGKLPSSFIPAVATEKILCEFCAEKYSDSKKEYCPICVRTYPSDEELAKGKKQSAEQPIEVAPLIPLQVDSKPYLFEKPSRIQAVTCYETCQVYETAGVLVGKSSSSPPSNSDIVDAGTEPPQMLDDFCDGMVECSECGRWVHGKCESINQDAFEAIGNCSHPVWGDEYLCPRCRYDLCNGILAALEERDIYGLFSEPVTDEVAPGYSEIIRYPMDLSSMKSKFINGAYKSLQTLRQDFELLCDNALRFNKHGDKYWKASLIFFLRGSSVIAKSRRSSLSVYGENILKNLSREDVKRIIANDLNKQIPKSLSTGKDSSGSKVKSGKPSSISQFEKSGYTVPLWLESWLNESGGRVHSNGALSHSLSAGQKSAGNQDMSRRRKDRDSEGAPALSAAADPSRSQKSNDETTSITKTEFEGPSSAPVSLPTKLSPYVADESIAYVKSNVLTLSSDIAYYDCCRDRCLICGSFGSEGSGQVDNHNLKLLFCTRCGEGFHRFCLFPDQFSEGGVTSLNNSLLNSTGDWRCANCSSCDVCDDAHSSDAAYIYCDGCDRAFHLACAVPKLQKVPDGTWYCKKCVTCTKCISGKGPEYFDTSDCRGKSTGGLMSGRIWGQSMDKCIVCKLSSSHENKDVDGCLCLGQDCLSCGQPTGGVSTDQISEYGRLRCSICLRYQHFDCHDKTLKLFEERMKKMMRSDYVAVGFGSLWHHDVYLETIKEYSRAQSGNNELFTCSGCHACLKSREKVSTTSEESFSKHEQDQQCLQEIIKHSLISKLYKNNFLKFFSQYEVKVKKLEILMACRITIQQNILLYTELLEIFPNIEDVIAKAFGESRKKMSKTSQATDIFFPLWQWQRACRFLDIMQWSPAGKGTAAEKKRLEDVHGLVLKSLTMNRSNVADTFNVLLVEENFDKVLQVSALASSFFFVVHKLLLLPSENKAVLLAAHNLLTVFSSKDREFVFDCFEFRSLEFQYLMQLYMIPLKNSQTSTLVGSGGTIAVDLKTLSCPSHSQISAETNYISTAEIDSIKLKNSEYKPLKDQKVVATISVLSFLKRFRSPNSKAEVEGSATIGVSSECGDSQHGKLQTVQVVHEGDVASCNAAESSSSDRPLSGSGLGSSFNVQDYASLDLEREARLYIDCAILLFKRGMLRDCPTGMLLSEYLRSKTNCSSAQLFSMGILCKQFLDTSYVQNLSYKCPDEEYQTFKRLELQCLNLISSRILVRPEKVHALPSPPAVTKIDLKDQFGSFEKLWEQRTALKLQEMQSDDVQSNVCIQNFLFLFCIPPMGHPPVEFKSCFGKTGILYEAIRKTNSASSVRFAIEKKRTLNANDLTSFMELSHYAELFLKCCDDTNRAPSSSSYVDSHLLHVNASLWEVFKAIILSIRGSCSIGTCALDMISRTEEELSGAATEKTKFINQKRNDCSTSLDSIAETTPRADTLTVYKNLDTSDPALTVFMNEYEAERDQGSLKKQKYETKQQANDFRGDLDSEQPSPLELETKADPAAAVVAMPTGAEEELVSCHNYYSQSGELNGISLNPLGVCVEIYHGPDWVDSLEVRQSQAPGSEAFINLNEDELSQGFSDSSFNASISEAKCAKSSFSFGLSTLKQFCPTGSNSSQCLTSNEPTPQCDNHEESIEICGWRSDSSLVNPCSSSSRNTCDDRSSFTEYLSEEYLGSGKHVDNLSWVDTSTCMLCFESSREISNNGRTIVLGRMIPLPCSDRTMCGVHVNCMLWSSGIIESSNGILRNSLATLRRSAQTVCAYCGEKGATVGCEVSRCKHIYHLGCAVAVGCILVELKAKDQGDGSKITVKSKKGNKNKQNIGPNTSQSYVEDMSKPPPPAAANAAFSGIDQNVVDTSDKKYIKQGDRRTVAFCPEHSIAVNLLGWDTIDFNFTPKEPMREITVGLEDWIHITGDHSSGDTTDTFGGPTEAQKFVAGLLSEHRSCLRIGALTIHSIGQIVIESPWFHTCDNIFPLGFESTRLNWSYKNAGKRTLYRFDVLSSDSLYFDDNLNKLCHGILLYPREGSVLTELDQDSSAAGIPDVLLKKLRISDCKGDVSSDSFPVFRVVAMDDPASPFLAFTVEDCFRWVKDKIQSTLFDFAEGYVSRNHGARSLWNKSLSSNAMIYEGRKNRRQAENSSGSIKDDRLRALNFFGLGLELTRFSIEKNRDAVVTMIPTICFPKSRNFDAACISRLSDKKSELKSRFDVFSMETEGRSSRKINAIDTIPVYRPRFCLPQRIPTVEVLRRLASARKDDKDSYIFQQRLVGSIDSCSRAHGFCEKRYGGVSATDEKSEFLKVTSAASQLLSGGVTSRSSSRSRSLAKRVTLDDGGDIRDFLCSPNANIDSDHFVSSGYFNLSPERLRAKLENDYWAMYDNNATDVSNHLAVHRSDIHGWGIYAQRDYLPNSMIIEYVGEQIRHTLADRREALYEQESGLSGSCYLFRLDKDVVVDATMVGGMARFLNHCCEPNSFAHIITTGKVRPNLQAFENSCSPGVCPPHTPLDDDNRGEQKHIIIMAARHIKVGEEITYDYKFPIEEGEKLTCHCGAVFCRGSMN